ncbi:hypothetical protein BLOT_014051 [Blomia tropicalis]|nr:hypothetical protein BLOT_014051 [Blomia tropicalis]
MTIARNCVILLGLLLVIVNVSNTVASLSIPDPYLVKWYTQKVDHLDYSNRDVFKQRYIISDKHWKPNGPIFFYAGNEGDIFSFANNTGFMWENAPRFNAMNLFMEHRYYGESLPYGNKSFNELKYKGYLTVEQALADYAEFVTEFKQHTPGARDSPVIVIGGSYGGMLASWMRMKYPHIVIGALAGSAPILQFPGIYNCSQYYEIATKSFENYSPLCSSSIRKSWAAMRRVAKTDEGRSWLTNLFRLCNPLTEDTVNEFISFVSSAWDSMAMTDYPNPASFLQPMPAYPIKVACSYLTTPNADDHSLIKTIYSASSVFYNYTGTVQCNNIAQTGGSLGDLAGWYFQACTEMILPICSNGVTDMFEPNEWNFTAYSKGCYESQGVYSDRMKALILFGGKNIKSASNIIFSNGLRDPWSAGGVLESLAPSLLAIKIPGACHHEDLRFTGPNDPKQLLDARALEIKTLKSWLTTYYTENRIDNPAKNNELFYKMG